MLDTYSNWETIERLPNAAESPIRNLLPKKNVYQKELLISRSEPIEIPKKQWDEIHDPSLPDSYAKSVAVESYFCSCIYVLRRSKMLSIAAQQSVDTTEIIEHSSSLRNSITKNLRLDATLDVSKFSDTGSLVGHIGASFELSTVTEYAEENRRTSTIQIRYEQCEIDRDVVFWDVAKVVVLYRRMKKGYNNPNIQMVSIGDFYFETYQKTYTYSDSEYNSVLDESSVMRIESEGMILKITGTVNAAVIAQGIQHQQSASHYNHCFRCRNVSRLEGAIQRGQSLHRNGTIHATPSNSAPIRNASEIKVNWENNTCVVCLCVRT